MFENEISVTGRRLSGGASGLRRRLGERLADQRRDA
jgi:hypothetical protein